MRTGKGRGRSRCKKGEKTWTRAGGEEKRKGPGGDHSTPPQTETNRAERRGGSDQPLYQEDREGERDDLTGYTPTVEDLQLQEAYGNWVHTKPGTHLHGGIEDNAT